MNKIISVFSLAVMALAGLFWTACTTIEETGNEPYLNVDSQFRSASGEGDGFLLIVRSNTAWTVSAEDAFGDPVDWIKFDVDSGEGDAEVLGHVLRGDRSAARSCRFVVRSKDGKHVVAFPFSQDRYVPVFKQVPFTTILSSAAALPEGGTDLLTDFLMFEAVVVGVPGENIPDGYVYLTDDGTWFLRAKAPEMETLSVGDKVQVETTEGTMTRETDGGITVDVPSPLVVVSSGNRIKAANIQASAVERYPNALVVLEPCLVQDAYLGKTWKGTVGMEAGPKAGGKFDVVVADGASFAGTAVPSGSCSVTGIVIGGKVHPRTETDLVPGFSGRDIFDAPYTIDPIRCFFKVDPSTNKYVNGTTSGGSRFTFSAAPDFSIDGAIIEKVGGTANNINAVVMNGQPFQTCFTTREWHIAGNYLLYTVPVAQKIYGDLEFGFSISCGNATAFTEPWTVYWGTDNENWKKVDAVYGGSNQTVGSGAGGQFTQISTAHGNNRHVAEFSIPESEAISSGFLYFKLVPPVVDPSNSTRTLRVNVGFVLSSRLTNSPVAEYHNVILNEAFEKGVNGISPIQGFPIYYFGYNSNNVPYDGKWVITGNSSMARGSLRMSSNSGENYLTSPALSDLTGTTDLVVTFKAAPYASATSTSLVIHSNQLSVSCLGGGTAGEIQWDNPDFGSDPFHWHNATCKIKGAGPSTQILIGSLNPAASNGAFYIDDIVVSR